VNIACSRSLPRRLSPFVFATKGPKRLVSRNASLPHKAFPANQAKPGLLYFYPAVATHFGPYASVKICYALPLRSKPPSFYLISPEAVLLTGASPKSSPKERALNEPKSGKGPTKSAGLGVLPVGGRIFLS